MRLFDERPNCCGCSACVQICPHGAITMRADDEGFAYPTVEAARCVGCGLCQRVCAFQRDQRARREEANGAEMQLPRFFAVKHRNVAIRSESQSGGLFTLLSDPVLARGGVVYGAGFRPDFSVCHQRAGTREERDALRGSKYVQSDMGDTFRAVRQDLADGREVLFSGTPCQAAGLRSFLALSATDTSRLLICDLVCHGTPSPMVWRDYLAWCERRAGQAIASVCFRDSRRFGWHSGTGSIVFENGEFAKTSVFSYLFYGRFIHRPSCHRCPYTSPDRESDVTMADYWGIERSHPEFDDNIGVSLAIVHSDKGMRAFGEASNRMEFIETNFDECRQPMLCKPSVPSKQREAFWKLCRSKESIIAATALRICLLFEMRRQDFLELVRVIASCSYLKSIFRKRNV